MAFLLGWGVTMGAADRLPGTACTSNTLKSCIQLSSHLADTAAAAAVSWALFLLLNDVTDWAFHECETCISSLGMAFRRGNVTRLAQDWV